MEGDKGMKRLGFAVAASAIALIASASAGIGADLSVGSPGVTANAHFQVTPFITLRGAYNFFEYELEDQDYDGIVYDADLDFTQFGGFVDVHPFMNGLTITGGLLTGGRSLDLSATPTEDVEIGDETFSPDEVGSLVGGADFGDTSYYAGVGWDTTTHGLMPIAFVLRVGLLMTDSPTIALNNVGGTLDPLIQAEIDAELEKEREQLISDFEEFEFFPMISIGIGIGF